MRRALSIVAFLSCLLASSGAFAGAASLLESLPFEAGMNHVKGNYAFSDGNYLVEGAQKVSDLGSPSIFIYMTDGYASDYPDKGQGLFGNPKNLTDLASSPAYKKVFNMPFKMYVITIFTFANSSNIFRDQKSNADVAAAEKAEVYNLTKYLYATYKGTGKVFILKNWEGDWFGMRGTYDTTVDIPANNLSDMVNWLSARQAGVAQARAEAGDPSDIAVLSAVEVNRPLDYIDKGMNRVINKVVPNVKADMLTYSSYDATTSGSTQAEMETNFLRSLNGMNNIAADPLGMGHNRMLVSEYGLYENHHPADVALWRIQGVLSTAKSWGLSGAFLWELYDNQCTAATAWSGGPVGSPAPIAANVGTAGRPTNATCFGLWYVRPDGTTSTAAETAKTYWTSGSGGGGGGGGGGSGTVTIYSPWSSTFASPVLVQAQCTSSSPIDHLEIWLDGTKLEDVFSSKVNKTYPMSPGAHQVAIICDEANGANLGKATMDFNSK